MGNLLISFWLDFFLVRLFGLMSDLIWRLFFVLKQLIDWSIGQGIHLLLFIEVLEELDSILNTH